MEQENLFQGQVREEGSEELELLVPGQQQSQLPSFPIPPALASHLGKVKI